ncbi:MAG: DNA mismatch repair protein MutS, partial [Burkholderiales bacterium]
MRQYAAIKKEHPSALLLFRLGDFYELFYDDAVVAARELQITLTARHKERGTPVPMCGVPYHSAEGYISKLIRKGYKVAVCEQMEIPSAATKLVRREVTRVITPGTAADASLSSGENNFLAALARAGDAVGFAALDLSTGEFRATEFRGAGAERRVAEELAQLRPREVLYASSLPLFESSTQQSAISHQPNAAARRSTGEAARAYTGIRDPGAVADLTALPRFAETPLDDWVFAPDYAIPLVENHFGVLSLEGYGLAGRAAAATAAGAVLHYVRATQRGSLDHVDRIGFYERQDCLVLDAVTVRNLELVEPLFAGTGEEVTLLHALDHTVTAMGKRLLRAWMLRPSVEYSEIEQRLDAVEALVKDTVAREEMRRAMEGVLDVERLLSRITLETANARDALALAASLGRLPALRAALRRVRTERLEKLHGLLDELADVRERIEKSLVPEPPLSFADGGVIALGLDAALDELRDLSRNSKQYIAQIEQRERKRTGIGSLKVKFNSVFGYYLEISKPNLHLAPPDYERKQTLVN